MLKAKNLAWEMRNELERTALQVLSAELKKLTEEISLRELAVCCSQNKGNQIKFAAAVAQRYHACDLGTAQAVAYWTICQLSPESLYDKFYAD